MTFTEMTKKIAMMIVANNNGYTAFTEYDNECVDLFSAQLRHLFMDNNGRKWGVILNGIRNIAGEKFYLGDLAKNAIVRTCDTYGIHFIMEAC